MTRFIRCFRLNFKQVAGKKWWMLLLIVVQMTLMYSLVNGSFSNRLRYYDYVTHYFDRTEQPYLACMLNTSSLSKTSTVDDAQALYEEIAQAAGIPPHCSEEDSINSPLPDDIESFIQDNIQNFDQPITQYIYDPGLLGIIPELAEGRWFSENNKEECVINSQLAQHYKVGDIITDHYSYKDPEKGTFVEVYESYRVIGVLAEQERMLVSSMSGDNPSMEFFLDFHMEGPAVITVNHQPIKNLMRSTMWFQTDMSKEELQQKLSAYGTVYTPQELIETYQRTCIARLFDGLTMPIIILLIAIMLTISSAVVHFGENRHRYAVMYLLGQSRRMLTGCTVSVYALALFLAYLLSILLRNKYPMNVLMGQYIPISVAEWVTFGVFVTTTLFVTIIMLVFFRQQPLKLYTESR